jgi:type III secretion protein V
MEDRETSKKYLSDAFENGKADLELRRLAWETLSRHAQIPGWTFEFGRILLSGIHAQSISGEVSWENEVIRQWWEVRINRHSNLYPIVTPMVLEIQADMVPVEAYDPNWYFIKEKVPEMRERILKTFGVHAPTLRIRANDTDLPAHSYVIMLDEVPIVMRQIFPDKIFITNPQTDLNALSISGESGVDPLSGMTSLWVDHQYMALLDKNNISYWDDPYDYMLYHLEDVIRDHLELFIQTQSALSFLKDVDDAPDNELSDKVKYHAKEIAGNDEHLVLFADVLRKLVAERIPIINKPGIINAFFENCTEVLETSELVQMIRLELKNELPFNLTPMQKIILPGELEAKLLKDLVTVGGKTFLAMTPEDCQEALAEIRLLADQSMLPNTMALVTRSSRLRFHLLKLVELEFPRLQVASRDEWNEN